jgi:Flp pilus assembly protein TadB
MIPMANDAHTGAEPSVTALVTGIINDAQELIKQQMALARTEIQADLRKTKEGARALALGLGIVALGCLLLCFMLVYLLDWAVPQLTLWGWFGIVGAVLAAVGLGLLHAGSKQFESFNPLPDQSTQALKENVQWLTRRK